MARKKDGVETALARLDQMLNSRDPRTGEILSLHAAIEQQMDAELSILLPAGDHLQTRLGFGQKIDVLLAATDNPFMPDLARALVAFNNLRNGVAHGASRAVVDTLLARLDTELQRTFTRGDEEEDVSVHLAAAMLVTTLAALNDVEVLFVLMGAKRGRA